MDTVRLDTPVTAQLVCVKMAARKAGGVTIVNTQMIKMVIYHYNNTPIQYTANFNGCKNDNFQMKFFNYSLIFCLKYNFGYTVLSMF